jgi:hypothetical protein
MFSNILAYLKESFDIEIPKGKEGFYAELFALFTTRRIDTRKQDILADTFSILDTVEILRKEKDTLHHFGNTLLFLTKFDNCMSQKTTPSSKENFIFSPPSATIGFVVACGTYIYGRNGMANVPIDDNFTKLLAFFESFLTQLEQTTAIHSFLALDTLEEMMSIRPKSNIGEHQRLFFFKSFEFLLQNYEQIETLEPCWRVNF